MPAPADARHLLIPFAGRSSPACHAATAPLQLPNLEALLDRLLPARKTARTRTACRRRTSAHWPLRWA